MLHVWDMQTFEPRTAKKRRRSSAGATPTAAAGAGASRSAAEASRASKMRRGAPPGPHLPRDPDEERLQGDFTTSETVGRLPFLKGLSCFPSAWKSDTRRDLARRKTYVRHMTQCRNLQTHLTFVSTDFHHVYAHAERSLWLLHSCKTGRPSSNYPNMTGMRYLTATCWCRHTACKHS